MEWHDINDPQSKKKLKLRKKYLVFVQGYTNRGKYFSYCALAIWSKNYDKHKNVFADLRAIEAGSLYPAIFRDATHFIPLSEDPPALTLTRKYLKERYGN